MTQGEESGMFLGCRRDNAAWATGDTLPLTLRGTDADMAVHEVQLNSLSNQMIDSLIPLKTPPAKNWQLNGIIARSVGIIAFPSGSSWECTDLFILPHIGFSPHLGC